ncbi:MAG: hypothetical protein PHU86_03485 [Patescibacteria group bacterium]|nr:hypothetical protein [Patescibacteria group bacterium]
MLSTEMELMFKGRRFSESQWYELVQARVDQIKPHLDTFTLIEFGRFEFLRGESSHLWPLSSLCSCSAEDFTDETGVAIKNVLKMQGLFWAPYSGHQLFQEPDPLRKGLCLPYPGGVKLVYSLTRKGNWVLIEVYYKGSPGYKGRGQEIATKIVIKDSDVPTICEKVKIKPKQIWLSLGKAMKDWARTRERIFREAQSIAFETQFLEDLVSHMK